MQRRNKNWKLHNTHQKQSPGECIWAIRRDSKVWNDSESFVPERFENSSTDFRGNHFEYISFGAGRRMCPGLIFGLLSVEYTLAEFILRSENS
ncbi:hypothetical protein FXO38_24362 [Capsicum annuum]|uniref:Uncharacterized protein n=1 Tax=Capsicum annuum TaxID=4072 RepID=A0A2G3A304_CAPAN|nr:hypothetical protein FXO38_24362 [Capsicum annuum]PHT88602.1 hypothetical protein T459_10708 [Capsicum annuum]